MRLHTETLGLALILLAGCANHSVTGPMTAPLAPLTPIHVGVSAGVMLEDLSQTQEEDDQEASALELIADCLSTPWYMTAYTAAGVGAFLWTLTDYPEPSKAAFHRHVETILTYLPIYHAAPASTYPKDPKLR